MSTSSAPVSIDEVLPGQLWIGNLGSARSLHIPPLSTLGITHVLSVCPDEPSNGSPEHMVIPVADNERADLLIHLPTACTFIQSALDAGGRVLVHCVMGVSRSVAVVSAYLMQTRSMTPCEALTMIRTRRPGVRPNYGFIRQLHAFAACGYAPTQDHPQYSAWRRRARREVQPLITALGDATTLIKRALILGAALPADPELAEAVAGELSVTHVLALAPGFEIPHALWGVQARAVPAPDAATVVPALVDAVRWMREAVAGKGVVYIAAEDELIGCLAAGAYFIESQGCSPFEASRQLSEALPLWEPTRTFTDALDRYAALEPVPPPPYSEPEEPDPLTLASSPKPESVDFRAVSDAFSQLHIPSSNVPSKPPPQRPRGATLAGGQPVMATAA